MPPGLRGLQHAPIQIQSWPPWSRNRESFFIADELGLFDGADTTIDGVPASWRGDDRLEIWHTDVTVVILGRDTALVERFASSLMQGPDVLTDLASEGVEFDPDCLHDTSYCRGRVRVGCPGPPGPSDLIRVAPIAAVGAVAMLSVAVASVLVRKRSAQRRFAVLATTLYLGAGLVAVTVVNALINASIGDLLSEPLPTLFQVLTWPLLISTYLTGGYGA